MARPLQPELAQLDQLIDRAGARLCAEQITRIETPEGRLPIWSMSLGSRDPQHPAIGFFGGVHGVERIGSQVLLAFLEHLVARLDWDDTLDDLLKRCRLVFIPIVNPGGFLRGTRANPAGIDLMRHAPIEAEAAVRWPLGGQRLSRHLPWYRGPVGGDWQPEARALIDTVQQRLLTHRVACSVDCHSGFGFRDRLWFPYAGKQRPLAALADVMALHAQLIATLPHHDFYVFEPQSLNYTTHGDLWDYLLDHAEQHTASEWFLPLTLEMGSWTWMRKNPRQLLNPLGLFNPLLPHRHTRVLRRHLNLFEFLIRAFVSEARWRPQGADRLAHAQAGRALWYPDLTSG